MKDSFYMGNKTVVVNLSGQFYQTTEDIVASDGFSVFLKRYFQELAVRDIRVFRWLTNGRSLEEMVPSVITIAKQLLVLSEVEISKTILNKLDRIKTLYIVEDAYNYWRSKQRFSVVNNNTIPTAVNNFIDMDTHYNQLILQLYRCCEEKLQGRSNKVYRQMHSGTNASCVISNYKWKTASGYGHLRNIPFVIRVMLRTPILFHFESNKREGSFVEVEDNPVASFQYNNKDWLCMPLKVNDLLCYTYFHKDYMANGVSLANLFELADEEECHSRKPDLIVLFGNQDDKEQCGFYHDQKNDIWIGSVSDHWRAEYFGYIKKAILTLHNLCKMSRGALPVHGSMMEIYFRDGSRKSLILIGDSGAGKSESIEAIRHLSAIKKKEGKSIKRIEVVFDDMGSLKISGDKVVANGTETGAFVRLDDLSNASAYQDMERSVFINPEKENARVILPVTNYESVCADHQVDMVLYANNYEERTGVERFENYEQGRQVFIDGKRMAMNTTQEKGLSSTYFANPFGPMQKQQLCQQLMDQIFNQLYANGVFVGQLFTNLGTEHKEKIEESAGELLDLLKKL